MKLKTKGLTILALIVAMCALVAPAVAQPSTPFMIYGWVNYTNGAPVNNPTVSINNTNTIEVFTAETNESYNYYQTVTSSNNVSTGDILHFNASNGNVKEFNNTVTETEINSTGGFVQNITISGIANHVVISEIQIQGDNNVSHDFVEIYNPTNTWISLSDYKLMKMTSSGANYTIKSPISDSSYIEPYKFYLWASSSDSGYPTTIGAEVYTTQYIATNTAVAIVRLSDGAVIDGVGWGNINPANVTYCEIAPYPTNPWNNKSLQRKVNDTLNEGAGPAWDTNNNSADFFIQTNPDPQNSGTGQVPPIPELSTLILFSAGLIILACYVLLKRRE